MNVDDTIVAISSPPGASPRGIVRLTGPQSFNIVQSLFSEEAAGVDGGSAPRCRTGTIAVGPARLPAAVYAFRAPRSYTRQDVAEIHLLGAPGVLALVVESCLAAGARRAEPGEFTARAYLAGALDLTQVHGIAGMIAAGSDLQLQAAERLLHGELSRTATAAREDLADLLSLVEGALDFADEPIEFIQPAELRTRLAKTLAALESTRAAGLRAERWGRLPQVLLAGPPNVGKSSLLNRLSGMDRAICAPLAGTTRDMLSAPVCLGDTDCLLVDAAGLAAAQGDVATKSQAAARRAMEQADLILHVVDAADGDPLASGSALPRGTAPVVIVANKIDRLDADRRAERVAGIAAATALPVCPTSALTGEGCEELKGVIQQRLQARPAQVDDQAIALMAEHSEALHDAIDALRRAMWLAEDCTEALSDGDLVAVELHAAADALGTLVGKDQTEDLLGRIFARFCVGK
jgi:tRNA modification GTPase